MATAVRSVESWYSGEELVTASSGRRLGGYALDAVIQILTLYIGWLIWAAIVAQRSQTPGKQLLSMYVMRDDGTRSGGAFMYFLRDGVVKGLLFSLLGALTLGILWLLAALWCIWDRERQCLWDKVSGTYVAYSPRGIRPPTAREMIQELRAGATPTGFRPLSAAA